MKIQNRAIAIGCLSVSLFFFGCMAGGDKSGPSAQAMPESLSDFTLKDLESQDTNLQATLKSHKAVLLNFWATWCPPCREEIPGLIDLQKKYGAQGFTVLGVDIGESQIKVSSFVQKIGINYPVVLDSDQKVAEGYGIVGIPTSFLISSDGKVLGEYHSYSPELVADVEKAIR